MSEVKITERDIPGVGSVRCATGPMDDVARTIDKMRADAPRQNALLRKSVHDLSRMLFNALTIMDLTRGYHTPDCECIDCGFIKRCKKAIRDAAEVLND